MQTNGILEINSNTALGTGPLTVAGSFGELDVAANCTLANAVILGNNLMVGGNYELTLTGPVSLGNAANDLRIYGDPKTIAGIISDGSESGAGSIDKQWSGTLILSGANTYTGGTTLTEGTLVAGNDSAFGSGMLTIKGGTLAASGTHTVSNPIAPLGGSFVLGGGLGDNLTLTSNIATAGYTITNNGSGNNTLSGVISGSGGITQAGTGTLTLTEANTYSGGTTLTGGTLGIGVDSVVSGGSIISGALGTGTLTVATGKLMALFRGTADPRTLANNIVINGALTVTDGWNLNLNGVISGAGRLLENIC